MSDRFVSFDQVRDIVIEALDGVELTRDASPVYLVRNLFGKLGISVAVPEEPGLADLREKVLSNLAESLSRSLGAYGYPADEAILHVDPGLLETLHDTAREVLPGVYWADRLVTGSAWWTVPSRTDGDDPKRYTIYSVKGGVGRSTTVAVLAWHLARQGEEVLVVDLDLESPGLASAMLESRAQPEFGVVDWFVESLVGQGDYVVERMVAAPAWTQDMPGTVLVVPAHGREPGEYLAKLGRAYMDTADDPWTGRLKRLLDGLEDKFGPSVVLLESRSGLHDIAAATVTDLNADVLLFALDSPSNWTDYRMLFDHWANRNLASKIRERLSIVSALTPEIGTDEYLKGFRENARKLFQERLHDTNVIGTGESDDALFFDLSTEDALHDPMTIHWTRGLAAGASLRHLERTTVAQAYGDFLRRFDLVYRSSTSATVADVETVRIALSMLPETTSHGTAPPPASVYIPPSHRKAMHPDTMLVTGMRGSGKTFWWSALQDREIRGLLSAEDGRLSLDRNSVVYPGFGVRDAPDEYPGPEDLHRLLAEGVDPRTIWRAVQAWPMAAGGHPLKQMDNWLDRVRYIVDYPHKAQQLFRMTDEGLDRKGHNFVMLFDALDRVADDWPTTVELIRGLLRHALEMRSYRRLRAKVFLRIDQVADKRIQAFPDASKVMSSAVELTWPRRDLYGLLWQCLGNGPKGKLLRPVLAVGSWPPAAEGLPVRAVPQPLAADEDVQRSKFHEIAGPWMGTDPRRGFPYTWIPNHLADAEEKVSPRSFIAALRAAAEHTQAEHVDHSYALHYRSIMRGVQEASRIRVRELQEDFPWVHALLAPLSDTIVPCDFIGVEQQWHRSHVWRRLNEMIDSKELKFPPRGMNRKYAGLRRDLESLGVFRRLKDGRVDVPDVFRIGYGLRRKGGVRPVR